MLALALWHTPRGKWWPVEVSAAFSRGFQPLSCRTPCVLKHSNPLDSKKQQHLCGCRDGPAPRCPGGQRSRVCALVSYPPSLPPRCPDCTQVGRVAWNVGGGKKGKAAGMPASVTVTIASLPGARWVPDLQRRRVSGACGWWVGAWHETHACVCVCAHVCRQLFCTSQPPRLNVMVCAPPLPPAHPATHTCCSEVNALVPAHRHQHNHTHSLSHSHPCCVCCSKVYGAVGLDARLQELWKHVSRLTTCPDGAVGWLACGHIRACLLLGYVRALPAAEALSRPPGQPNCRELLTDAAWLRASEL